MFAIQTIELVETNGTDVDLDADVESGVTVPVVDPWAKARCRDGHGTLTHLFFSDELMHIARAKAICAKCPLTIPCLSGAVARAEPWGVWGGQLVVNGRVVTHKRPRGRPPKHPRPELVVDEVPLPRHYVA